MAKEVVNYMGDSLRTTYGFTGMRDNEVARHTAGVLIGDYQFGGNISRVQLVEPVSGDSRVVIFRETAGLSNREAARAGLIPEQISSSSRLIMPQAARDAELALPFIGAFLPLKQLETATKLSIHEIAQATKASIPDRLLGVQKFAKALAKSSICCVLDGLTVVDIPGANYAASELLSTGESVVIKYGRASLGQDQWTFCDATSYQDAMRHADESIASKGARWQDSGLVFERKLASHDQLVAGQIYFMGQLVSWIGKMDHAPVRNIKGENEVIYTGSSKIFVAGGIENLMNLPLPPEAIEDLAKAAQFGQIMEDCVKGGAVTRMQYNILRGEVETKTSASVAPRHLSGVTEITLRGGGGSGAEIRVVRALSGNSSSCLNPPPLEDSSQVVEQNGVPMVMGITYLEYFPTEEEYQNAEGLPVGSGILFDGTDPTYGFVRIYTCLQKVSEAIGSSEDLKKFLYPNATVGI